MGLGLGVGCGVWIVFHRKDSRNAKYVFSKESFFMITSVNNY